MTNSNHWNAEDYELGSILQLGHATQFLEKHPLAKDAIVLDMGCGNGRVTQLMAESVKQGSVLGIDRSAEMIEHALSQYQNADNIDFQVLDILNLNFNQQFTDVISFSCLHWIKDTSAVFKKIYNALKPHGKMLITFPHDDTIVRKSFSIVTNLPKWKDQFGEYKMPLYQISEQALKQQVEDAGFQIDAIYMNRENVLLPNLDAYRHFLAALPLFHDYVPEERRPELTENLVTVFKKHCDETFGDGQYYFPLMGHVVRAHRTDQKTEAAF
jgi:trans-aconitate 2-methyltransferase